MIPPKIKPFFKQERQAISGDNNLVSGTLNCCDADEFGVFVKGRVKHGLFSGTYLAAEEDAGDIAMGARCRKCGKSLVLFDSSCDGYEHQSDPGLKKQTAGHPFNCIKCGNTSFSVRIQYEYPSRDELEDLHVSDIENSYTWIWITPGCNQCGKVYKNFIDCET